MGYGDELLVKPGTIFLAVMILAVGYGLLHWAGGTIKNTSKKSMKQQDKSFHCSGIYIKMANLNVTDSQVKAYFMVNRDVRKVYLNFEGNRNVTREVDYPGANSLEKVSVQLKDFKKVSMRAPPCEQVFEYE